MDVLVIGGTGLISTGITRQLVDSGHDVTCLTRGESDADLPGAVDFVHGDRNDDADLQAAREEADPDCVIDMVCFAPEQAESAVDVFEGVEQYVFCSTVDVYHRPLARNPITEDAAREPAVSEYGENKAECENIFMTAHDGGDFEATVIRPWSTYGEGGPVLHTLGVGTYYVDRIRQGKPIVVHGNGQSLWGPCNQYHRTVADALDAPEPDLVHIPTDVLAQAVPDRTGMLLDHFQFSTVFDNSKAKRDLDFEYTVSFEEGVRRTVDRLEEDDEIDDWDSENDDEIIAAWREAESVFLDAVGE